jgi:Sigma-70 region 2
MASVGLTLPWEHKLSSVARDGERRVEPFEGKAEPVQISDELPQDAAIAAACLSGNLEGYERLYRWQGTRMKNLARNLLGSQSDAEDAVQETFLKIQRRISSFRGQSSSSPGRFASWSTPATICAAAASAEKIK